MPNLVDEYVSDVASLIAVLQRLEPSQKLIGPTCKAMLHVVEQESGSVLVVEARKARLEVAL